MRRSFLAILAVLPSAMSGCSWFEGGSSQTPLTGERIAILQQGRIIEPDASLALVEVRLPQPKNLLEWPQAGGHPEHNPPHLAFAEQPREIWRTSIGAGSGSDRTLLSTPVVAGNRIYTLDTGGVVSALETESGRKLWQTDIVGPDEADAVVAGGIAYGQGWIFAATGAAQVVALDAETGVQVWRQSLQAPMRAAPTVVGERLFVVSIDNQVQALSKADGRKLWSHSGIFETAAVLGGASPAVENGVVVVPFSSGELFALRAENGRTIWADSLQSLRRTDAVSALADIRGLPVIDRDMVFAISHAGRFVALDLHSGDRIWDQAIAGREMPWVAGDWVYALSVSGEVYCLSRRNGKVKWATPLPQFERPEKKRDPIQWAGPLLAEDRLILTSSVGRAISLSPYTGEILGEIVLPGRALLPPILANRTLYILTDEGQLVAYR